MTKTLLYPLALGLCLSACKGGDTDEPYSPVLVPYDTFDTNAEPDPLAFGTVNAAEMRIVIWFGWDEDLGEVVVPASIEGDTGNPGVAELYLWLYAAGWQDASESDQERMICHVGVEIDGLTNMDEGDLDTDRFWGLDVVDAVERAHETCIGDGFDPNQFADQDPIGQYADLNWQFQFGGELEQSTKDWLTDSYGDGEDFNIDHYHGASLTSDAFSPDFDDNWFRGWRMDPTTYDVGATDFLTKLDYDTGGNLATGYYIFDQNIFWNVEPVGGTTSR